MEQDSVENRWRIETLRLTALTGVAMVPAQDTWANVVGGEPDATNIQRAQMMSFDYNNYENYALSLIQFPGRADWILGPRLAPSGAPLNAKLPDVGDFASAWSILSGYILPKWFEVMPASSRVAITGSAHVEHADINIAASHLKSIFPTFDIGSPAEFALQMNTPTMSPKIPDQYINLIQRWSISQTMLIHLGPSSPPTQSNSPLTRLEFDCNNRSDSNRILERAECSVLVDEMTAAIKKLLASEGHK